MWWAKPPWTLICPGVPSSLPNTTRLLTTVPVYHPLDYFHSWLQHFISFSYPHHVDRFSQDSTHTSPSSKPTWSKERLSPRISSSFLSTLTSWVRLRRLVQVSFQSFLGFTLDGQQIRVFKVQSVYRWDRWMCMVSVLTLWSWWLVTKTHVVHDRRLNSFLMIGSRSKGINRIHHTYVPVSCESYGCTNPEHAFFLLQKPTPTAWRRPMIQILIDQNCPCWWKII